MIGRYDDYVQLEGGILYKVLSVSDPAGAFYVQCSTHRNYVRPIYFSEDPFASCVDTRFGFMRAAQDGIDQCPECLAEKKSQIIVAGPGCAQEEHDACGCEQ
jgi:hypothetical protein